MPEFREFETHKREYVVALLRCFDKYAESERTRLSMWKALVQFSYQEPDEFIGFKRLSEQAGTSSGIDAWALYTGVVEKGSVNNERAYKIRREFIQAAQSISLDNLFADSG